MIELTINHAANMKTKKSELAPTLNITNKPKMISIIPRMMISPELPPAKAFVARRNKSWIIPFMNINNPINHVNV